MKLSSIVLSLLATRYAVASVGDRLPEFKSCLSVSSTSSHLDPSNQARTASPPIAPQIRHPYPSTTTSFSGTALPTATTTASTLSLARGYHDSPPTSTQLSSFTANGPSTASSGYKSLSPSCSPSSTMPHTCGACRSCVRGFLRGIA